MALLAILKLSTHVRAEGSHEPLTALDILTLSQNLEGTLAVWRLGLGREGASGEQYTEPLAETLHNRATSTEPNSQY